MLQAAEVQGTLQVGPYLRQWLDHMRGRVRAKTHEGYEGLIRLYALPHLEGIPLTELRPLHLQALYSSLYGFRTSQSEWTSTRRTSTHRGWRGIT